MNDMRMDTRLPAEAAGCAAISDSWINLAGNGSPAEGLCGVEAVELGLGFCLDIAGRGLIHGVDLGDLLQLEHVDQLGLQIRMQLGIDQVFITYQRFFRQYTVIGINFYIFNNNF